MAIHNYYLFLKYFFYKNNNNKILALLYCKDDLGNLKSNSDYAQLLSFVLIPETLKSLFYNLLYAVNLPVFIFINGNDANLIPVYS